MAERKIDFDWSPVEPAHSMAVKLHDDLRAIYTHIRDKYQGGIDQAFDKVSRQIGFVVTTTVPVVLEVGNKRSPKGVIIIDGKPFQGTLFDRELTQALRKLKADPIPHVSAGTYRLYLIWFEALKLRLRTEWMEPAHAPRRVLETAYFRRDWVEPAHAGPRVPGIREPAHWFDPGVAIAAEETVLISVIDEVYPELRLIDRIAYYREAIREEVRPEVREPAHFRRVKPRLHSEKAPDVLSEIADLLHQYGY